MILFPDFEDSELDRQARPGTVRVPEHIRLKGERLAWGWGTGQTPTRTKETGGQMLDRFVRLADAEPSEILDFAREWGPLQICEHGIPASHNSERVGMPPGCLPLVVKNPTHPYIYWEPLERWRLFSRHAGALRRIAIKIHQGEPGEPGDWTTVRRGAAPAEVERSRRLLAGLVNLWLELGDVRPQMEWRESQPSIAVGIGNLMASTDATGTFGALAVQLLLSVIPSTGLYTCSACAVTFTRDKPRPAAGRRRFCPVCGPSAARAHAARDYRRRRKNGG